MAVSWSQGRSMRSLLVAVGASLLALTMGVTGVEAAAPSDPAPTRLTGAAPAAFAGNPTTYTLTLTAGDGVSVEGRRVQVQRFRDGWVTVARGRTDAQGRFAARLRVAKWPTGNGVRGVYAGSSALAPATTGAQRMTIKRRTTRLRAYGPDRVVDEHSIRLTFTRATGNGDPVPGPATVQTGTHGVWRNYRRVRLDAAGRVRLSVRPREDSGWRLVAPALPWVAGGFSPLK